MQDKQQNNSLHDGKILRQWIGRQPYDDFVSIKKRILSELMIPNYTLTNYMAGYCKIPPLYKLKINEITKDISNEEIFVV
jgi:hypothetical protein